MSDSIRRPVSKLSFITTMFEGQVGAGAGAHRAADEVDGVGDLLRPIRSAVPWSSSDAVSAASPSLPFGSDALPGPHEHPQADHRLLVVKHDDDLQPVRQRLQLRTAGT